VPPLKTLLSKKLLNAERVAVLGVGSELRGDDAAGLLVVKALAAKGLKKKSIAKFKVFLGATAPENLSGEIRAYKPTHIIIVDAVEAGSKPGEAFLVDLEKISNASFCTHNLPINILVDYLQNSLKCQVLLLGIRPKKITFGSKPSLEVLRSAKSLAVLITQILS